MVRPVNTNTGANSDLAKDRNEDPITGEPGAHPVGTGWVRLLVALQLGAGRCGWRASRRGCGCCGWRNRRWAGWEGNS